MRIFYSILIILFTNQAYSQLNDNYVKNIKLADGLYKKKLYKVAASTYSMTFQLNGGKGMVLDRYKAACCYAMSLNSDSSFLNLYRIVEYGHFVDYSKCLEEESFKSLYNDSRWIKIIELMKKKEVDEIENLLRNTNEQ
jgi:hypothetical protein